MWLTVGFGNIALVGRAPGMFSARTAVGDEPDRKERAVPTHLSKAVSAKELLKFALQTSLPRGSPLLLSHSLQPKHCIKL